MHVTVALQGRRHVKQKCNCRRRMQTAECRLFTNVKLNKLKITLISINEWIKKCLFKSFKDLKLKFTKFQGPCGNHVDIHFFPLAVPKNVPNCDPKRKLHTELWLLCKVLPGGVGQRNGGAWGSMPPPASRWGPESRASSRGFGPTPWVLPLIWSPHDWYNLLLWGRLHRPAEKIENVVNGWLKTHDSVKTIISYYSNIYYYSPTVQPTGAVWGLVTCSAGLGFALITGQPALPPEPQLSNSPT